MLKTSELQGIRSTKTINLPIEEVVDRFLEAIRNQEGPRKLEAIRSTVRREDLVSWKDKWELDILHHAIMMNYPDAVDFLLKLGYFAEPYEPHVNLYAHLAALLGYTTTLRVLLTHRPHDFKRSQQPLFYPSDVMPVWQMICTSGDAVLPGIVGKAMQPYIPKTVQTVRRTEQFLQSPGYVVAHEKSLPTRPSSTGNMARGASRKLIPTHDQLRSTRLNPRAPYRTGRPASAPAQYQILMGRKSAVPDVSDRTTFPRRCPLYEHYTVPNQTPLEVAAYAFWPGCVKLLLDMCIRPQYPQMGCDTGYFSLAVLADCPPAIKVLLKLNKRAPKVEEENHRVEDFRQAVRLALQMADIECLDMLLADTTVDVRNMYRPNNYFHILYITTSRAPGTKTIHLLPAATRTMIFRDHNVNSKIPSRTYPLYTLINCSFRRDDFSLTKHFIDSMIILLEHGVNPNFDEVSFERHQRMKRGFPISRFRSPYSSAFHCLFDTVESAAAYISRKACKDTNRFILTCVSILGQFSASTTQYWRVKCEWAKEFYVNALTHYLKISVLFGVEPAILNELVRFGADPSVLVDAYRNGNLRCPINVYFDALFDALTYGKVKDEGGYYHKEAQVVVAFFTQFMTPTHIIYSARIVLQAASTTTSQKVQYSMTVVGNELWVRAMAVPRLRDMAAWRVWQLCGRRINNVLSLPNFHRDFSKIFTIIDGSPNFVNFCSVRGI